MGQLHLAVAPRPDGRVRVCALKRILPHLAASDDFRDMFLQEARVLARLSHPNLLQVHEVGQVGTDYFLAMEYLPGEDLAAILARARPRGPLPIEIAVRITLDCAAGLHYVHDTLADDGRPGGLVHRDVNPSNVMVTYGGGVKVLDFGVAKARVSLVQTMAGTFKGKVSYASPEQLTGEPIDRRSDIFSMGILLWEALTGQVLFDGTSQSARLDAVRAKPIPPPSAFRAEIPARLDAIVLRALERSVRSRYQTGLELSQELREFLDEFRPGTDAVAVARWMESVFGAGRSNLKKAIAAGEDLERNFAQLTELDAQERRGSQAPATAPRPIVAKAAWSTDLAGGISARPSAARMTTPPPGLASGSTGSNSLLPASSLLGTTSSVMPLVSPEADADPSRKRTLVLALSLVVGSILAAGALYFAEGSAPEPAGEIQATGSLEITTDPPGAQVLIGGEPVGRTTPATLSGLLLGRDVRVSVNRPGFQTAEQVIKMESASQKIAFGLVPTSGRISFEDVPNGVRVYVDNQRIDPRNPSEFGIGQHELRLESTTDVIATRTIEVKPGQTVISLREDVR